MLTGTTYWLAQSARVSWYLGQYLLSARIQGPLVAPSGQPKKVPTLPELLADLRSLLLKDWRNIQAGYYALPHDLLGDPRERVAQAVWYFQDLPVVKARRLRKGVDEVPRRLGTGPRKYPRYYLQNFHYQTDGYLSDHSARL